MDGIAAWPKTKRNAIRVFVAASPEKGREVVFYDDEDL
jgi:hypothetical protein